MSDQERSEDVSVIIDESNKAKAPRLVDKPGLTIVESVVHRASSRDQPTLTDSRFSRELSVEEQPYTRQLKISEEWKPLDIGWIKEHGLGMFIVQNNEGTFHQVNPSPEEKEEVSKKVLEISFSKDPNQAWLVLPRENFRGTPTSDKLFIRCRSGIAKCLVTAFAK